MNVLQPSDVAVQMDMKLLHAPVDQPIAAGEWRRGVQIQLLHHSPHRFDPIQQALHEHQQGNRRLRFQLDTASGQGTNRFHLLNKALPTRAPHGVCGCVVA